jgi:hypothetical protein
MSRDPQEITTLLMNWKQGDRAAGEELISVVYPELRRLAAHYLRPERPDHTLQATALVHELYPRLFGGESVSWENRARLFAVARSSSPQDTDRSCAGCTWTRNKQQRCSMYC